MRGIHSILCHPYRLPHLRIPGADPAQGEKRFHHFCISCCAPSIFFIVLYFFVHLATFMDMALLVIVPTRLHLTCSFPHWILLNVLSFCYICSVPSLAWVPAYAQCQYVPSHNFASCQRQGVPCNNIFNDEVFVFQCSALNFLVPFHCRLPRDDRLHILNCNGDTPAPRYHVLCDTALVG